MATSLRLDDSSEYKEVLTSSNLAQFLATQDWTLFDNRGADQIWVHTGLSGTITSVKLPRDARLVDYGRRFGDALGVVSEVYDWSLSTIAEHVAAVHADMFFVRVDQSMSDGTIPLRQAAGLLESIDQMVRSAALTAYNPRSSGRGRVPKVVQEFLDDDVRMGHTKRGSFIITVVARLDQVEPWNDPESAVQPATDELLGSEDESFGHEPSVESERESIEFREDLDRYTQQSFTRGVTATLSRGIQLAREVASESINTRDLADEELLGMRLPIIQALGHIGGTEGLRAIDVAFEWAPSEPSDDSLPTNVHLDRSVFASLPSIERRLARAVERRKEQIIGPVVELKRPDEYEAGNGEIVIRAEVGGRLRRIIVPLSGEDYDLAITAHLRKLPFLVSGVLGKRGNSWALTDDIVVDRSSLRDFFGK